MQESAVQNVKPLLTPESIASVVTVGGYYFKYEHSRCLKCHVLMLLIAELASPH